MRDRVTRTEHAIVLCHLGVARLERDAWRLTIDGLVRRPRTLAFRDLADLDKVELTTVHQCAGSPLAPAEPTQRVCNVVWAGARLADVLDACGVEPAARYVWSYGADHGEFSGVRVDAYAKDLPLDRVQEDVLLAYEMNGAALAPEHGFPVRLVVPGYYGTNSVKWLTRMTLAPERVQSPFTTRWYNDPVVGPDGRETGETQPVWAIAPQSVIVAPAPDMATPAGRPVEVWGWAWADGGVARVDVTTDAGAGWREAQLEPAAGRAWQRFSTQWTPRAAGPAQLAARAFARGGQAQAMAGQRNAITWVAVDVQ
jgi:DMSO/TMAO reductase YedYZ molybdopterin-dependent catalytic subunit